MSKKKYNPDVIYLCKLPSKENIEKEFGRIVNDDVVLTKERIKHIEKRRNYYADFVTIHLLETIKEYDFILTCRDNCVRFIKEYDEVKNNILVKLSLNDAEKANSVMTGMMINNKELKRLIKKYKIIERRKKKY